jgi:hypothetical protein
MAEVYLVRGNNCQLANQLVLFASVYAWCLQRGHRLHNPSFADYARHFDRLGGPMCTPGVPGPWTDPQRTRWIQRSLRLASQLRIFGPTISARQRDPVVQLPPTPTDWVEPRGGRIFLSGWNFRNPAGLITHHAQIVDAFRPAEPVRSAVAAWRAALEPRRLHVGVHIRHGDYREFLGGRFYFTIEQHAAAMNQIAQRHARTRPVFHIFSNEPRTVEEFAPFAPGLEVRIARPTTASGAMEDLYRLACCDLLVGAMSTFSLWAAIYGRTLVWHLGRRADDEFGWFNQGHPSVIDLADADNHVASRGAW